MAVALLTGLAVAQELVWERRGVQYQTQVGDQTVVLGDVDGDGFDDLLSMAWTFRPSGPGLDRELQLWLLSGRDGSTLRIRPRLALGRPYDVIAATGDMDGDGTPDYAVTIGDQWGFIPGLVQVCSGRDDSVIWQVQGVVPSDVFGLGLRGDLDLDGDGKPDLIVNAHRETQYGVLYAYRNDGSLLYRLPGTAQTPFPFPGINTVARVGDLDRDGADDFVVGTFDVSGSGAAAVLSGRTGRELVKGAATRFPFENVGQCVDGAGDVDGDGVPDFAASSYGCLTGSGVVLVFSGRTGQELRAWTAPQTGCTGFGAMIRGRGLDFDQDGVPDLVAGAPQLWNGGPIGAAFVLSGRDGSFLHGIHVDQGLTRMGSTLEVMAPQPGTSFPSFVLPERDYSVYWWSTYSAGYHLGRIRVFRGSPSGVAVLGSACRVGTASHPKIGIRDLGSAGAKIHLSSAPPATTGFLLLGLSDTSWGGLQLPLALDPFGLPGCRLYTSVDLVANVTTGTAGIDAGYASVTIPFPLATQPPGTVTLFGQWLTLGSGNTWPGAMSAALRWRH